jgi:hypothetical protein
VIMKNEVKKRYQSGGPVAANPSGPGAFSPGDPHTTLTPGTRPLPKVGAKPRVAGGPLADYLSGAYERGYQDGGEVNSDSGSVRRRGQGGSARPARPGRCGT